ncbi:MAG: proline--tRNA ligase [Candidatus Omnitrophota bacterium]
MFWSKTLIPTLKEVPQETESVSQQLLLRAGLVRMLMAGVYSYLPLGLKALKNIERIIRQEMNAAGASELLLPALQPIEIWQRSGRDKDLGEVMIRFQDRRGRKVCLGPTHEEVITDLVKNHVSSYKQLPLVLYQIQTKFRDEIRPRFGLIRACEFIMKDAYSFDANSEGLDKNYKAMLEVYKRIFKRCGLEILITEADPGVMGGNESHEFMVPSREGEDIVLFCPACRRVKTFKEGEKEKCVCDGPMNRINAIEIGHIFKLGTKYSGSFKANFLDAEGKLKPLMMGCYGIGVSRLISGIVAQNNDKDGIVWPKEVAPYQVNILALDAEDPKIMNLALSVYEELEKLGLDTLLDDRAKESSGAKFKDADLLGIPLQVIIGKQSLKKELLELKIRHSQEKIMKPRNEIIKEIGGFFHG